MLHEEQLRRFIDVWKNAKASGISLPDVEDPDYASLDTLLAHVFRWARTYVNWICEKLGLPDPGIKPAPESGVDEAEVDRYLDHVLKAWVVPLRDIPGERASGQVYPSPWGVPYSIHAMLEHAVMHPILHRFQLEELMGER
jgi:hypothetical protein